MSRQADLVRERQREQEGAIGREQEREREREEKRGTEVKSTYGRNLTFKRQAGHGFESGR